MADYNRGGRWQDDDRSRRQSGVYGRDTSGRESDRSFRQGGSESDRDDRFNRWASQQYPRQSDYRHSDYRNYANMSDSDSTDYGRRSTRDLSRLNPAEGRSDRNDRYSGSNDRYRGSTDRYSGSRDRYSGGTYDSDRGHNDRARDSRGHHDDERNVWSRSVDEVRSWFGDEEAERRRQRDEEERMRAERLGAYHNHAYREDDDRRRHQNESTIDWSGQRGYGSNIDQDYGRNSSRSSGDSDNSRAMFRSSNNYGGSRSAQSYRDYPTHQQGQSHQQGQTQSRQGRSSANNEDDEIRHGYESQFDYHQTDRNATFGGRDYERNYPTRAERNYPTRAERGDHTHDLSEGWQSSDSYRGYRSLNNTGREAIGQDNHLGRERSTQPNEHDKNFSRGDYSPNLSAGGQDHDSRHYPDRDRQGTRLDQAAQQGYSQGYGRTGFTTTSGGGQYNSDQQDNAARGVQATYSGKGPKNYGQRDERIKVDVCEALSESHDVDASDIDVTVSNGEVNLTGSVDSRSAKRTAERLAEQVSGVVDVHNRIEVKERSASDTSGTQERIQPRTAPRTDLAGDGSSSSQTGSNTSGVSAGNGANGSTNGGGASASASANGSSRSRSK